MSDELPEDQPREPPMGEPPETLGAPLGTPPNPLRDPRDRRIPRVAGPCVLVMFGSPDPRRKVEWIADETAARHGASVERTTGRDAEAYGDPPPAVIPVPPPPPFGPQIGAG